MKRENLGKIISIILLLFWCGLIFYFSNQVGSVSEDSSSRILLFLDNIFKSNLNNSIVATFIVRKLAHIFLYFVLYILCFFVSFYYDIKKSTLFGFLFCFLYAVSDEVHQLFIYERSFGVIDILIDLFGSFLGYLFLNVKCIRFFD